MTSILRVLFGAVLVVTLGIGLLDDCQPCEDPSQLFCQKELNVPADTGQLLQPVKA